jgi:hypothetical protein
MKKDWSIEEVIFKLPLLNIKLKAHSLAIKASRTGADSVALRAEPQGMKVGLKSFNGSFVTAEINRNGELIANRPKMATWETFELFRLPDGKVTLRACNGKFVGTKLNKHGELVADRPYIRDWETFTVLQLADGKIAFKAVNDMYVSANLNRNGELFAVSPKASGWEAFTLTLAD